MSIEVANESGFAVDETALAALARHVLDEMRMHPLAELSVLLVDVPTIADLHQRWMGEEGPTDVLAFPMDELRPPPPGSDRADRARSADSDTSPAMLGDVVLCPEVATEQAREAQRPVEGEVEHRGAPVERLVSPAHFEGKEQEFFLCGQDGKRRARYRAKGEEDPAAALERGDILSGATVRGDVNSARVERIKTVL